jgi:hypothetical protein
MFGFFYRLLYKTVAASHEIIANLGGVLGILALGSLEREIYLQMGPCPTLATAGRSA